MSTLLKVSDLSVAYGAALVVDGVSLEMQEGEIRVILGANGAGKSTIIKTLLGLVKAREGGIQLDGAHDLTRLKPHQIHALGIAWVPEGRKLWGSLTVLENLRMGAFAQSDPAAIQRSIADMFDRFPRLKERRNQLAGSLSGGEQQMVAIARALVAKPRLLLMDEPSVGLAPLVVKDVFALVAEINREGISVLMVEQNARQALALAHWAYLLEIGQIVESGPARDLAGKERVKEVFLGGGA
jgi:branched-chain amino acid transport system ATP-binding protein